MMELCEKLLSLIMTIHVLLNAVRDDEISFVLTTALTHLCRQLSQYLFPIVLLDLIHYGLEIVELQ